MNKYHLDGNFISENGYVQEPSGKENVFAKKISEDKLNVLKYDKTGNLIEQYNTYYDPFYALFGEKVVSVDNKWTYQHNEDGSIIPTFEDIGGLDNNIFQVKPMGTFYMPSWAGNGAKRVIAVQVAEERPNFDKDGEYEFIPDEIYAVSRMESETGPKENRKVWNVTPWQIRNMVSGEEIKPGDKSYDNKTFIANMISKLIEEMQQIEFAKSERKTAKKENTVSQFHNIEEIANAVSDRRPADINKTVSEISKEMHKNPKANEHAKDE